MTSSTISNVTLYIVYLNVVLYATCYQLQRPIEPFMVEKLGLNAGGSAADAQGAYMQLQSFFSILQMVGSLFIGMLVDRIGSKGGFILCFSASALSYGLLAHATSIEILYLSKIPTIFQAGFLCAQSAVVETTPEGSARVAALGRLTVCYTIGSIIGPAVGGLIGATGDYQLGAQASVAGSLLSVVLCLFMQAPVHSTAKKDDGDDVAKGLTTAAAPHSLLSEEGVIKKGFPFNVLAVMRAVWLLLGTKLVSGVANSIASFVLPLVLKDSYGMNEAGLGLTMSVMSAFNALVNGFLLAPITNYFQQDIQALIRRCLLSMCVFYGIQSAFGATTFVEPFEFLNGYYPFIVTCIVLSMFQYVLSTVITSESTSQVERDSRGTLIGLEHSLFALARIWTPQLGLAVLTWGGVSGVSAVCGGVYLSTSLVWACVKQQPLCCAQGLQSSGKGQCRGEKKDL